MKRFKVTDSEERVFYCTEGELIILLNTQFDLMKFEIIKNE